MWETLCSYFEYLLNQRKKVLRTGVSSDEFNRIYANFYILNFKGQIQILRSNSNEFVLKFSENNNSMVKNRSF